MSEQPGTTTGLVDRHRNGDAKAGAELLAHASKRLEVLARRMIRRHFPVVRNLAQTWDLMQETNIRLMKALEQVHPESSKHWWNILRQHLRWAALSMAESCKTKPLFHNPDVENLVDGCEDTNEPFTFEEWEAFHEQVELLPDEEEKDVFNLRFYGGLSVKDTATELKVSEKTVKRRWLSVKLRLSRTLGR